MTHGSKTSPARSLIVGNVETERGGSERAVEGPQGDAAELGGGQEIRVDVAQAKAHQAVGFDEVQDFLVACDRAGAEDLEQFENQDHPLKNYPQITPISQIV